MAHVRQRVKIMLKKNGKSKGLAIHKSSGAIHVEKMANNRIKITKYNYKGEIISQQVMSVKKKED